MALLAPQQAMAADAGIVGIHVTQSVQSTSDNSVPLVADRGTAIRALVSEVEGDMLIVTGRVHVTVDGVRVTPPAGIPPLTSVSPVANPSLDVAQNTLNFELLPPTGIAPRDNPFVSDDVDVRVDISALNDTNPSNDSFSVENLRVESKASPVFRFRRLRYTPFATTMPTRAIASASFVAGGRGDAYLRQVLPLDQTDPGLYVGLNDAALGGSLHCPLFSVDPCSQDPMRLDSTANSTNPGPPEADNRLRHDAIVRMVLAAGSDVQGESLILYEWLPDATPPQPPGGPAPTPNPSLRPGYAGLGALGSGVGLGMDAPNRGQSTFAHEVGHNLGLVPGGVNGFHNAADFTLVGAVGWDVGGKLIGNPTSNNVTVRLKRTTFLDRWNPNMNGNTSLAWITRRNYEAVLDLLPPARSRLFGNKTDNVGPPRRGRPRCVRDLPVIFGSVQQFDRQTMRAQELGPLQSYRAAWCNVLPIRPGSVNTASAAAGVQAAAAPGDMSAVVDIQTRQRRRRLTLPVDARILANTHDVDPPVTPSASGMALGPFTLQVPVAGQIRSIRILDEDGKTILNRRAPKSPPKLSVTVPRRNSRITRSTTLRWSAKTPGPARNLRYVVAYSPDKGRHWAPLGVELKRRTLRFNPREVTRSSVGRIRIIATDGINSDAVTITGLAVK